MIRKTSLLRDRSDIPCGQARDDTHLAQHDPRILRSTKRITLRCWRLRVSHGIHIPPERSERSPLHDVRNHARRLGDARRQILPDEPSRWWSQTGSNRRPPACKAGALPAELWPRSAERVPVDWRRSARRRPCGRRRALSARAASEKWWAWEDLNFRPHAYQARALTN